MSHAFEESRIAMEITLEAYETTLILGFGIRVGVLHIAISLRITSNDNNELGDHTIQKQLKE